MPLWSWYEAVVYRRIGLFEEIGLNIVLFIPIGAGIGAFWKTKPWKALLIGLIFAAFIEITQYFTCRGLFEWDDMIHNALGCWIGCRGVRAIQQHN
ncbi:MAG: VanZ family protein [Clostridiaceae bacterium]|nr:VanZ family protein [Clostridiaceae bacterium]